jgi:MFS family permease
MFYYAGNIIIPTTINVFFSNEEDYKYQTILTLPQNLGIALGAALLSLLGSKIGHWRWTLAGSVAIMVILGALLALGDPSRKG